MSIYLQIVDVLLGCVQFDVKNRFGYYDATSRRAQEKSQLVRFVKSKLGIRSEQGFLAEGHVPSEWHEPSVFTVSKGRW